MAWRSEMVPLLRGVVGDWTNEYDEEQLVDLLVFAAHLLLKEVDFVNTYTVTVSTATITPDPSTTPDTAFMNLVVLKASILVLRNAVKTLASQSYMVVDGPSKIATGEAYKNTKELYDDLVKDYHRAVVAYKSGDSVAGQSILGPYSVASLNNTYLFG